MYRLRAGTGRFNLGRWSGNGGTSYTVSAVNAVLTSTQPGRIAVLIANSA